MLNDIVSELQIPVASLFADYQSLNVAGSSDFVAIVRYNEELKEVTSVGELEKVVQELKNQLNSCTCGK